MTPDKKQNGLLGYVSSLKFNIVLLIVIIIGSIAGTLMPAEKALKFVYGSFWFISLEIVLIISIITCCIKNIGFKLKKTGMLLIHLSIPVILAGALIGNIFGEKGFIELNTGEENNIVQKEHKGTFKLPFNILLKDFTLEKHPKKIINRVTILNKDKEIIFSKKFKEEKTFKVPGIETPLEIIQIIPDFSLNSEHKAESRSEFWNNPAIKIKFNNTEGWLFSMHQFHSANKWKNYHLVYTCVKKGGEIKDFKSKLAVIDNNKTIMEKTIEVNDPLKYRGYVFYQSSFDIDNLNWTGLQVKRDPGVSLVYLGYLLLIVGMFWQLFMPKPENKLESSNE